MPEPRECRFAKTHEWACPEGAEISVGLSEYAQKEIGDIVFIELPKKGRKVSKGESVGAVESVKAAFDLYAPVSGEVVASNAALSDDPSLPNRSPHDEGWIFKIKPADGKEIEKLMDYAAYQKFLEESKASGAH